MTTNVPPKSWKPGQCWWQFPPQEAHHFLRETDPTERRAWAMGQGPENPLRVARSTFLAGANVTSYLDVGCGTGIELETVRRWCGPRMQYVGIDVTPNFVAAARQWHSADTAAEFHEADFLDDSPRVLPACEAVLTRHVLEHLPDHELFLVNLTRCAQRFVFVELFIWCEGGLHTQRWQDTVQAGGFIHRRISISRLAEELGSLGFEPGGDRVWGHGGCVCLYFSRRA